jgi:hypothetical protein
MDQAWRRYHDYHRDSIENREDFWFDAANEIEWFKKPTREQILTKDANGTRTWCTLRGHKFGVRTIRWDSVAHSAGVDRWFADGKLNTSYLTLDVHVDKHGRGDQVRASLVPLPNCSIIPPLPSHEIRVWGGGSLRCCGTVP